MDKDNEQNYPLGILPDITRVITGNNVVITTVTTVGSNGEIVDQSFPVITRTRYYSIYPILPGMM